MGPIFAIILFNTVIFVIVIVVIVKHTKRRANKVQEGSNYKTALRLMLSIGGVMVLFGLTWLFAAFTILEATIAFQFIFAILNSLQGFFIFLFYCVIAKDARMMWTSVLLRLCGKGKARDVTSTSDARARRAQHIAQGSRTTGGRGTISTGFDISTAERSRGGSYPSIAQESLSELPSYIEANIVAQELDDVPEGISVTPAPDSNAEAESDLSVQGPSHTGYPYSPPEPSPAPTTPPTEYVEQPQSSPSPPLLLREVEGGGHTRQEGSSDVEQEDEDLTINVLVERHTTTRQHHEITEISLGMPSELEDEESEIHVNPSADDPPQNDYPPDAP